MKNSYQIQVAKIDNGYIIVASSDDGQRKKLAASDEKGVQQMLKDVVDQMFVVPEKPKT